MISYLLWQLVQFCFMSFCLIFMVVTVLHFRKMKRYAPYREQGVYLTPGYDKFPLGNLAQVTASVKEQERVKNEGLDPIRSPLHHMLDQLTESKEPNSFDYAKHSNIMMNLGISIMLIADPLTVQEIMVNKNAQVDKTGQRAALF